MESSGSNRFVVLLEAEGRKECGRGFLDEVGSNIWQYLGCDIDEWRCIYVL